MSSNIIKEENIDMEEMYLENMNGGRMYLSRELFLRYEPKMVNGVIHYEDKIIGFNDREWSDGEIISLVNANKNKTDYIRNL